MNEPNYKYTKDLLIKLLGEDIGALMIPGTGTHQIKDRNIPVLKSIDTYKDIRKFFNDFNEYYSSRIDFYNYFYNEVASKIFTLNQTIEQSEYVIDYSNESNNVNIMGSTVTLKQTTLDSLTLKDPFFIPEPDVILDDRVCYYNKPKISSTSDVYQVFRTDSNIVPDDDGSFVIFNDEMDTPPEDDVKYIGFKLDQSHPVVINEKIYFSYEYPKTRNIIQSSYPNVGYFIKDINIFRKMQFKSKSEGLIESKLLGEDIVIPINNTITEKPISYQDFHPYYILYFSYPIVSIKATEHTGSIVQIKDNVIVTEIEPNTYFQYVPALDRTDKSTGSFETLSLDSWTETTGTNVLYRMTDIPNNFSLEKVKELDEDIITTSIHFSLDMDVTSPITIPLDSDNEYNYIPYKVILNTPNPITLYEIKEHDSFNIKPLPGTLSNYIDVGNDDLNIGNWNFIPFMWTHINDSVLTNVNQSILTWGEGQSFFTDGVLNLETGTDINIYYYKYPKKDKIYYKLIKSDVIPYLYYGGIDEVKGRPIKHNLDLRLMTAEIAAGLSGEVNPEVSTTSTTPIS